MTRGLLGVVAETPRDQVAIEKRKCEIASGCTGERSSDIVGRKTVVGEASL